MFERFLRYRPRPRIMNWLMPLPFHDDQHASYAIIAGNPPIFYVPFNIDDQLIPMASLDRLYDHLQNEPAHFLLNWFWQIEEPKKIHAYRKLEQAHCSRHPGHRFYHLCNTTRQFQRFRDEGLNAIFCNQNCLVDEMLFRPLPEITKEFDAVYDGRFIPYKRHELASRIESLGLIYAYCERLDTIANVSHVKSILAHAHFFNHPDGGEYKALSADEVNQCLNRCRTGLCLSSTEGAMYGSIQYLLAGLPVVSTHSEGGRDVMFDERFVLIAEASPEAVAAAVSKLCHEAPPAQFIRERTLEKIQIHRQRLIDLVQQIFDDAGVARDFSAEWPQLFFNKLYHPRQSHQETIAFLKNFNHGE